LTGELQLTRGIRQHPRKNRTSLNPPHYWMGAKTHYERVVMGEFSSQNKKTGILAVEGGTKKTHFSKIAAHGEREDGLLSQKEKGFRWSSITQGRNTGSEFTSLMRMQNGEEKVLKEKKKLL